MTPVTIIAAGETRIYATPREAILALFAALDKPDLSPLFWADMARAELRRWKSVPLSAWPDVDPNSRRTS